MKTFRAHAVGNKTAAELDAQDAVVPAGHLVQPSDNATVFRVGDGVTPYTQLGDVSADA